MIVKYFYNQIFSHSKQLDVFDGKICYTLAISGLASGYNFLNPLFTEAGFGKGIDIWFHDKASRLNQKCKCGSDGNSESDPGASAEFPLPGAKAAGLHSSAGSFSSLQAAFHADPAPVFCLLNPDLLRNILRKFFPVADDPHQLVASGQIDQNFHRTVY